MNEILKAIAERDLRKEGVYGIRRAYDYVSPFVSCVGDEACQRALFRGLEGTDSGKLAEVVKASEQKLVYSNEDTVPLHEKLFSSTATMSDFCKSIDVEMPAKAIMVFANIVTTPKKDRDGDKLMTDGAQPDPKMPLLWHHMLPMPIGKMIKVLDHTPDRLMVASALIDSELGNDAAMLTEFGALRISHGFRPLEFELLGDGKADGQTGFKITKFEIMEESLVSVPSNTDAIILAHARGKLHDPTVKQWAKAFHDSRPVQVPGMTLNKDAKPCKCHEKDALVEFIKNADEETLVAVKEAMGLKETPERPFGTCVTCGSALDDTSTCTNSSCGQIQSAKPQNKAGRVLSTANMKKLEQAKEILNEVLASATAKNDNIEPYDTEDEELSPNPARNPDFADVVQFLASTMDRGTLALVKQEAERRERYLDDAEWTKAIGAAR